MDDISEAHWKDECCQWMDLSGAQWKDECCQWMTSVELTGRMSAASGWTSVEFTGKNRGGARPQKKATQSERAAQAQNSRLVLINQLE